MEPRLREPKMRDRFRKELRAQLMQQAPLMLAPRRENAWTFLRPAMAVGLAGLVLFAGAGTAAAGSVPGDPAFGLKKAFESLQVTLTFDDVQRVRLLAEIADRRLEDLQKVANRDDKAPTASEEFAEAVAKFRAAVDAVQQAAPGGDKQERATAVQNLVDAARDRHEAVLDEVQQKVGSDEARAAIERAKDAENKDTADEQKDQGKNPQKTPRPARTPSRFPAPTLAPRVSGSPRTEGDDRGESTRPAPTPHSSAAR
jgi:hypothetical protein